MKKSVALILAVLCVLGLSACKGDEPVQRERVSDFAVATFEYIEDDGYKLITSEIDSLDTFDGLLLKPADVEFDGEWIYRIIYNPAKYSKNTEEFVILFGAECVSVNGTTYIGDGAAYSGILDWAAGKYKFFDYELITD